MTTLKDSQNTIILLNEEDGGTVRLVPFNRDQFCVSVEDAIQGCSFVAATYSLVQQVADLRERLGEWIEQRHSSIQAAYLSFRRDGLLFVVVQRGIEKDVQLAADLTELDIEIASDDKYSDLSVDVMSLPGASSSATSAFLSSGRVQEYAGQKRSRDVSEGKPQDTAVHPHED